MIFCPFFIIDLVNSHFRRVHLPSSPGGSTNQCSSFVGPRFKPHLIGAIRNGQERWTWNEFRLLAQLWNISGQEARP
jgi:hypothetical protein